MKKKSAPEQYAAKPKTVVVKPCTTLPDYPAMAAVMVGLSAINHFLYDSFLEAKNPCKITAITSL
jgi:hypothetical protein